MNEILVLHGRPTDEDLAALIAVLRVLSQGSDAPVREHAREPINAMRLPQPRGSGVRVPRLIQRDLTNRRRTWPVRPAGTLAIRQSLHAVHVERDS